MKKLLGNDVANSVRSAKIAAYYYLRVSKDVEKRALLSVNANEPKHFISARGIASSTDDLKSDILRSALKHDLSEKAVKIALEGDQRAVSRLMEACVTVAAVTGCVCIPTGIVSTSANKRHGGAGGKSSGIVRRKWQQDALLIAQRLCDELSGDLSQADLADAIIAHWRGLGIKPWVGETRLIQVIRDWERRGLLLGRRKAA